MRQLLRNSQFFLFLFLISITAMAQETTATLSGRVADKNGLAVPGASILVVHEPTGARTGGQSNNKGIFVIPNLKPGGPYSITISFVGFEDQRFENVNLNLGNNPEMQIDLRNNEKSLQEVVVQTGRRPSGLVVGTRQLNTFPTLGRSLSDF